MLTPRSPETVNWVAAQQTCSAEETFRRLREQVKADVDTRNAQLTSDNPYRVFVDDEMMSKFTVSVACMDRSAVSFQVVGDESIHVEDTSGTIRFDARVRVNRFGIPRFFITDDRNSEQAFDWQLRMRALKSLFFGGEPAVALM